MRDGRGVPIRTGISIALFVVLLGLGGVVIWGVRNIITSIPTPSDLAEAVQPRPYEEIGPVVISSIRKLANLTTIEVVEYTMIEKGTDRGWLAWARGDSIQLFAVARIGAGVDLSRITIRDISVDTGEGVVEMVVPHAEIQYVAVDNEATQILDRRTGLFTRGDPRLESDAREVAEEVLVRIAQEEGILAEAEANAREVLTNFLLGLGYRDVIVEFDE